MGERSCEADESFWQKEGPASWSLPNEVWTMVLHPEHQRKTAKEGLGFEKKLEAPRTGKYITEMLAVTSI